MGNWQVIEDILKELGATPQQIDVAETAHFDAKQDAYQDGYADGLYEASQEG